MVNVKKTDQKSTLLGYELTTYHNALVNYLLPSIAACILYIFIIAVDVGVIFTHFKNDDPIWGSLTLFFMYLPALGSFVIIVSNWELWPEFEECSKKNTIWLSIKITEHLFFPVWNMWRFAERIFWAIEALRAKTEDVAKEALSNIVAPRTIELYVFLQSYLHALPQILLQIYILIRLNATVDRDREYGQVFSLILNLAKLSITTTYYQRFRSQKLTGKQYPWYKQYKMFATDTIEAEVILRNTNFSQSRSMIENKRNTSNLDASKPEPERYSERRRSSDFYLEPSMSPDTANKRQTLLETSFDEEIQTESKVIESVDEVDKFSSANEPNKPKTQREISVVDVPQRALYRETGISERSEPDFNVSRVIYVKGLEDDDIVGKLVAFLWWYTFLLARVLSISVFAYFFMTECFWLIGSHFLLVITILSYDVKSDAVKRAKALFFIFIGLVYIFCIIEFKIQFKKSTFIYYGFFVLVFAENFITCMIWYLREVESLENDYWFRYVFYIIIICSLTSLSSMIFYFIINKPSKVVVQTRAVSVSSQRIKSTSTTRSTLR